MVKASLEQITSMVERTEGEKTTLIHLPLRGFVYSAGITFPSTTKLGMHQDLLRRLTDSFSPSEHLLDSSVVVEDGSGDLSVSIDNPFADYGSILGVNFKVFQLSDADVAIMAGVTSIDDLASDQRAVYRLDCDVIASVVNDSYADSIANAVAQYVYTLGNITSVGLNPPAVEVVDDLRGQPFIGRLAVYTSTHDLSYGESMPRDCGICFFRYGTPSRDCSVASDVTPKIVFGIGKADFMPTELDGKAVGDYCSTWTDPRSE
jgi:hypothetical protein